MLFSMIISFSLPTTHYQTHSFAPSPLLKSRVPSNEPLITNHCPLPSVFCVLPSVLVVSLSNHSVLCPLPSVVLFRPSYPFYLSATRSMLYFILTNKANFYFGEMFITYYSGETYERKSAKSAVKNKANSKPILW